MTKTKIPQYIKEVEDMDVFDKMLIWNHCNVNQIYIRTVFKFNKKHDYFADSKITFNGFNIPYTTTENKLVMTVKGKSKFKSFKVSKERFIHHWHHLFKQEIFNGRKV